MKPCDFSFHFLTNCINEATKNNKLLDFLKLPNKVSVHKKKDPIDKTNYRPVSILPLLPKVFEKVMYPQFYDFMEKFLNQLLCGFLKAHPTQHALFKLIQSPFLFNEVFLSDIEEELSNLNLSKISRNS